MARWKFQKAKDVHEEVDYVGFIKYMNNKIVQEFYVPEPYLKEGKINVIPSPKTS